MAASFACCSIKHLKMRLNWRLQRLGVPLLSAAALCASGAFGISIPAASIRNGTVHGVYNSQFHQDFFLGIPYAHAPRLAQAEHISAKFKEPFQATEYGATCYGFGSNQVLNLTQSEECLNLNIIRPAGFEAHPRLPVLLWIYGGGWRQGSSADPMWNLSYITKQAVYQDQPVLTVSINYRLSFLGLPSGQEVQDAGVSNLGLKDQRQAFRWVQENIAAFGGDPDNVTIWGESAGGCSVSMHLIANGGKGSEGLFHRGIAVSGFTTGVNPSEPAVNQPGYDKIVANAGCSNATNSLHCLRAAPLDAIYPYEDTTGSDWNIIIDGDFIADKPALELEAGHVLGVPLVLGGNSDEGLFVVNTLGVYANSTAELAALLGEVLTGLNSTIITQLLDAYPEAAVNPPYSLPADFPWCEAMAAAGLGCSTQYRRESGIFGDFFTAAPRRFMAQHWARMGLPTYSFRFDTDPTAIPIVYWNNLGPGFALHGAELAYEFGLPPGFTTSIDYYPPVKDVPTHQQVSLDMISHWISFAYCGDPNAFRGKRSGQTDWKAILTRCQATAGRPGPTIVSQRRTTCSTRRSTSSTCTWRRTIIGKKPSRSGSIM